jgi:dihydrofolate reductase
VLSITKDEDEVMVIGGASLCEQLLPQVSRLYITKIEGKFDGDVYFPEYDESDWRQVSCESHPSDDSNQHAHHFLILER